MFRKRLFLLIYIYFFHSLLVFSEPGIENVIVSGTRFESTTWSIPSAVTVITAEDIALSGADHIVDILRTRGGLEISDLFGDGTDANVGIRGFSSTSAQNTLIMIDGRRLNNVDNSLPDLNSVSLKNLEQIEIVKGSLGTLYGDKAVGGVINIITRNPDELDMHLEAQNGSYNNRSLFASIEDRFANGLGYRFSAHRRLNDNYRDNNQLRLSDLASKVSYQYSSGKVFAEYQYLLEIIELPGALFGDLLNTNRKQPLNAGDNIETDTQNGRIGLHQNFGENVELLIEYTNRINNVRGTLSSAGTPEEFSSKRHHIEFTPRIIGRYPLSTGDAVLTLGLDIFKTDYFIQSDFGITDDTQTQHGLYARVLVPIIHNLITTFGARYGKIKDKILVDTISFGRSLPQGTSLNDDASAWELGFSYIFNPDFRIFAKVDKNYRFVTADEYSAIADNNFFSELFNFGTILPLPVTQTGKSYEIGADWQSGGNSVSLQHYQLDINDEIVFDPVAFVNTNLGNTRRRGIIFDSRYEFTDKLFVIANYSYLHARYTTGDFMGKDLTFLPRHRGGISASYLVNEKISTHMELIGIGERQFGGDFADNFSGLPGYSVININTIYMYDKFKISFRINNLLNKNYSDSGVVGFDFRKPFPSPQVETFYPAPKRNYMLTLQYNYQ